MTNEQIEEAQKLIASMRNHLAVLTGTTDANKLAALVLEKRLRILDGFKQLRGRVWRFASPKAVAEFQWTMETVKEELYTIGALAHVAERNPDHKANLVEAVGKKVSSIDAHLDKIEHALSEKANPAESTD